MTARAASKHKAGYMIGNIGMMLAARFLFGLQQWAMVTILARSADSATVGVLGYGLALVVPLTGFFGMGMRQGIATDLSGQFGIRDYLATRVGLIALMTGTAFAVFFLLVDDPISRRAALLLLLPKGVELMSEMAYGVFQRHGRLGAISQSLILRAALGLAGFWAGLKLGGGLDTAILTWGAAWTAVYLLFDARQMRRCLGSAEEAATSSHAAVRSMLRMVVVQAPIALGALAGNLGNSAPRLILEPAVSLEALGVFTAIFMLFQAANTLAVAVLQLFMTPLARATQVLNLRRITQLLGGATALVLLGLAVMWMLLWLFGSRILVTIYGPDYAGSDALLLYLAGGWSAAYLAIIFRYIVTAMRSFRIGLFIDGVTTAVIVAACVLALRTMPEAGMVSVAIGFAIGQWLRLGLTIIVSAKLVRLRRVSAPMTKST